MSEAPTALEDMTSEIEAPDIDEEINPITISVNGTQVHVTNAADKVLEIYNLAGVRVASFKIDSDDKTVNINLNKGCYILKVDKVVRKVSIK
ncbi:MAG: T9SS type A sorting domain-containing protein [Bacteroidaceae bacterium]|nr:T9SS type A sorting domain-containing protein [Bacteroidaceae bacterium]